MNKLEKIINEDMVNHGGGDTSASYSWQNRRGNEKMSLVDILKADKSDWEKARKVIPHQVQTVLDRVMGLADTTEEIKLDFIKAYSNPMVKDDTQMKETIKDIVSDLNKANKLYVDIVTKLDSMQY